MEGFLQRTGWSPVDAATAAPSATEPPPVAAAVPARAASRLRLTLEEEEVAARE